ncbi:hypothetical protein K458DRAFT_382437 [Lentithecium fluviatile CBS 122367]|uniref:Uncharacterized protein n=1 Tax=Lentithecium fluviatile CBS 122367 TaxID=1168545 RepID=A0A6G1JL26_9PLEO|nr:hypothetical protein K458DRAFT_382437 [Lentithecium fluviatile CBS 122367]
MSLKFTTITKEAFDTTLSRYPSLVPAALHTLDAKRYADIPSRLDKDGSNSAYLKKEEIVSLVEWKLKHGTFRPKLLNLVKENADTLIEETTKKAFALGSKDGVGDGDVMKALKILSALKGIGPATASLLLSVYHPEHIPFFSDELFRWVMWDEPGKPGGWKRAIKYNNKEYEELIGRVEKVRERLGVRAVDCEKVAWVLGKDGVDLDGGAEADRSIETKAKYKELEQQEEKKVKKDSKAKPKPIVKSSTKEVKAVSKGKGTKRKADETVTVLEGVRRSSRRKTDTYYGED